MYQLKYWNQLKELRAHVYYVQFYSVKQNKYDYFINVFLAITSSSSIAAWALWNKYQLVWACIIASSQVITAIKPLLPYKKRLSALNKLGDMLSLIALQAERDWYHVAEGKWDEELIHTKWADLKENALAAENKCLIGITLPKDETILHLAENEADKYLNSTYT